MARCHFAALCPRADLHPTARAYQHGSCVPRGEAVHVYNWIKRKNMPAHNVGRL